MAAASRAREGFGATGFGVAVTLPGAVTLGAVAAAAESAGVGAGAAAATSAGFSADAGAEGCVAVASVWGAGVAGVGCVAISGVGPFVGVREASAEEPEGGVGTDELGAGTELAAGGCGAGVAVDDARSVDGGRMDLICTSGCAGAAGVVVVASEVSEPVPALVAAETPAFEVDPDLAAGAALGVVVGVTDVGALGAGAVALVESAAAGATDGAGFGAVAAGSAKIGSTATTRFSRRTTRSVAKKSTSRLPATIWLFGSPSRAST